MPRTCTVCAHPERAAIDAALVAGGAFRNIAKQYAVSPTALFRHRAEHIPAALSQAQEAAEVARADDLLGQVRDLQGKALGILTKAEVAGQLAVALGAIREARGNLELLAKLLHQIDDRPQVNVLVMPEWVALRTVLLRALASYPDARLAVVAVLEEAERAAV